MTEEKTVEKSVEAKPIDIVGRVSQILFAKEPELGSDAVWMKGYFLPNGEDEAIPFVGVCPVDMDEDTEATLHGIWTEHKKYGRQFAVDYAIMSLSLRSKVIQKMLADNEGLVGIGPVRSTKIAEYLQRNNLNIDDAVESTEHVDRMREEASVPLPVMTSFVENWKQHKSRNRVILELLSLHFPKRLINRFLDTVSLIGDDMALVRLRENPYYLIKTLEGYTFAHAELVAQVLQIPKMDSRRIKAAFIHAFDEKVAGNGHTLTTMRKLQGETRTITGSGSRDDIKKHIDCMDELIAEGELIQLEIEGFGTAITIDKYHAPEKRIQKFFSAENARAPNPFFSPAAMQGGWIDMIMGDMVNDGAKHKDLSAGQREALHAFVANKVSVITGAAGSGKTLTIAMIMRLCLSKDLRAVRLMAPTGKAAVRMRELLAVNHAMPRGVMIPFGPQTIHMALMSPHGKRLKDDLIELMADVVIIDEFSMVDVVVLGWLLEFLPKRCAIVFVGDHNQIPSVDAGAVLRDVVMGNLCHVTKFDHVWRNAGVLRKNAARILEKSGVAMTTTELSEDGTTEVTPWLVDVRPNDDMIAVKIAEHYRRLLEESGTDRKKMFEVQAITAQNMTKVGVHALNSLLRPIFFEHFHGLENVEEEIEIGEKVLQTKNDYEANFMNGEQGIVEDIVEIPIMKDGKKTEKTEKAWVIRTADDRTVKIRCSGRDNLGYGYAITIHKFQGSEAQCVILPIPRGHRNLTRKLIYTGATRASKSLVIVGDREGIADRVKNTSDEVRLTLTAPREILERARRADKSL